MYVPLFIKGITNRNTRLLGSLSSCPPTIINTVKMLVKDLAEKLINCVLHVCCTYVHVRMYVMHVGM